MHSVVEPACEPVDDDCSLDLSVSDAHPSLPSAAAPINAVDIDPSVFISPQSLDVESDVQVFIDLESRELNVGIPEELPLQVLVPPWLTYDNSNGQAVRVTLRERQVESTSGGNEGAQPLPGPDEALPSPDE